MSVSMQQINQLFSLVTYNSSDCSLSGIGELILNQMFEKVDNTICRKMSSRNDTMTLGI